MGSAMRRSTAQFLAAEAGVIALPPTALEPITNYGRPPTPVWTGWKREVRVTSKDAALVKNCLHLPTYMPEYAGDTLDRSVGRTHTFSAFWL